MLFVTRAGLLSTAGQWSRNRTIEFLLLGTRLLQAQRPPPQTVQLRDEDTRQCSSSGRSKDMINRLAVRTCRRPTMSYARPAYYFSTASARLICKG